MRCTQFIGLNERARKLIDLGEELAYTIIGKRVFPNGSSESYRKDVKAPIVISEIYNTTSGMFGEELPLYSHLLPRDKKDPSRPNFELLEVVQESPWSSGPCIFLALQKGGKWVEESKWTDEEIEEHL